MTSRDDERHIEHVRTLTGLFGQIEYTCWRPYKRAEWKRRTGQLYNNLDKKNLGTSLQYIMDAFDFEAHRPGSKIVYVRLEDYTGDRLELGPAMGASAGSGVNIDHAVCLVFGRQPRNQYDVYVWTKQGWGKIGESYKDGKHWNLDLEGILYAGGATDKEPKKPGQARLEGGDPWMTLRTDKPLETIEEDKKEGE